MELHKTGFSKITKNSSDVKYRLKFSIDTIDYFCKAYRYYRISIDYLVISFAIFTRTVNEYEKELKNWKYTKCKTRFFFLTNCRRRGYRYHVCNASKELSAKHKKYKNHLFCEFSMVLFGYFWLPRSIFCFHTRCWEFWKVAKSNRYSRIAYQLFQYQALSDTIDSINSFWHH